MSGDGYFGERIAATYEENSPEMFAPEEVNSTVEFLAGLAGEGRALEFGIGTGRIALPLAERGVPVHGIDMSKAMVQRLRAKPGTEDIGVTIGDFATTTVDGKFSLAYLVYNTINNLTTQAEQVACFRNATAHLEPGGCFVIEVLIPILRLLPPGENLYTYYMDDNKWDIDEYHIATQAFYSHHFRVEDGQLLPQTARVDQTGRFEERCSAAAPVTQAGTGVTGGGVAGAFQVGKRGGERRPPGAERSGEEDDAEPDAGATRQCGCHAHRTTQRCGDSASLAHRRDRQDPHR